MFDEIGHVEILEDLISNYFVSRTTLNETVVHLTGRFACLLREYGISDSEILPIDIDGKSMASREETQEQTQERDAVEMRADIVQRQRDRLEDQCEQLELERNHYWDDRDRLRD